MSEISIQVRRVTEKVKQYYSIFGLRPFARMSPGRSVIKGGKRLGFDEVECVVAETARGTSVGFYAINQVQALIHSIPFVISLLILGLAQLPSLGGLIQGTAENSLPVNLHRLLLGNASFSFMFILMMVFIAALFVITEILVQRIRVEIIKSRFSFYSREAIWETKDIPLSLISLQAVRSVFNHVWMLAIVYFAIFSSTGNILGELLVLYNSSEEALYSATIDGFVITGGLVLGLLTSYKAILLRKQYGRTDEKLRISGGLIERRVDPIIFGVQSALISGVLLSIFFSFTFMTEATAVQLGYFLFFVIIGGLIAGTIQAEGDPWIMASYAVFIFFTSVILIFQTGEQPAYAYIVVLQLFFIPIPFIILLSNKFDEVLRSKDIRSREWYFDLLPMLSFLTLYLMSRKEEAQKRAYERSLEEEVSMGELDRSIRIEKAIFEDTSSDAYKLVRHYFEILFTYTASYEETQFITLPSFNQLDQWWMSKTGSGLDKNESRFIRMADQMLWDPDYVPELNKLRNVESTGKSMVLELK